MLACCACLGCQQRCPGCFNFFDSNRVCVVEKPVSFWRARGNGSQLSSCDDDVECKIVKDIYLCCLETQHNGTTARTYTFRLLLLPIFTISAQKEKKAQAAADAAESEHPRDMIPSTIVWCGTSSSGGLLSQSSVFSPFFSPKSSKVQSVFQQQPWPRE